MTRREDPVPLGDVLDEVTRELGAPPPSALAALVAAWGDVVGDGARHAALRSVRDGVLTVAVDDPAWATRLRYRERELLAALRRRLGEPVATRVRVVVERPRKTGERGRGLVD